MRNLLRVVNIPVRLIKQATHATPHFMSVSRYLSHGDDPYNQCAQRSDLPAEALLVDPVHYNEYFGPQADPAEGVGRGVDDAIADLPPSDETPDFC